MDVTFLVPSTKRTIGGLMALYEFANGLSRRGHRVHLVHLAIVDGHIEHIDDLAWFPFEPGVVHHLASSLATADLPPADFIETTAIDFFTARDSTEPAPLAPASGLPFLFVQAYGIFSPQIEARAFRAPYPKVCIARWLVDALRDQGIPAADLEYIPYGLDHGAYRLTRPIAGRPPQIAMLYNAHPIKGARFGMQAIEEVWRRLPETRAVLFGNKDPDRVMPAGVTYTKLPPRELLVNEIYNGSRVFLCSSVSEGFGFCSIEAMASGCAVVTTDNGGSDDYAIDEETALVCAPRDVAAMADRIERLLRDDALHERIATNGHASVRHFDWDESARRLEEFFGRYRDRRRS